MPKFDDIQWFKSQFGGKIDSAVQGTPFNLDMLTALACQESGYIWQVLRKKQINVDRLLDLCVGDTIDKSGGRSAFPRTKSELLARPKGQEMFEIARKALVDMAQYVKGYESAVANADKFCHGFGVFQYDLQFFLKDPGFFLDKRYADFDQCLRKCVEELHNAMRRINWQEKTTLTDHEAAFVAIAYNAGGFKPNKGLKQGHFDGKKYYGEQFFDYLRMSKTVALPDGAPASLPAATQGIASLPPPTPVTATGWLYEVDVRENPLRLRNSPETNEEHPNANVIARLPDGHIVQALMNKEINGFLEVETSLLGAHYRGFASARYLKRVSSVNEVVVKAPAASPPADGIVAVYMPRKQGTVTRRIDRANAHTLNEPNQPARNGSTPDELRSQLAAIVDWLAVDKGSHLRYQPHDNLTFCNIYAHDFCHLAGVYLPRVWWTPAAIEQLAQGKAVQPLYGSSIDEQRANDLFYWLRDFGLRFGWRRTGTLSKLQLEVNQGAIGLIVACRKDDGRPGHIVVVVPETNEHKARRNAAGEVTAPMQSQAGTTNFRYGTGKLDWFKSERFAECGFWLHA